MLSAFLRLNQSSLRYTNIRGKMMEMPAYQNLALFCLTSSQLVNPPLRSNWVLLYVLRDLVTERISRRGIDRGFTLCPGPLYIAESNTYECPSIALWSIFPGPPTWCSNRTSRTSCRTDAMLHSKHTTHFVILVGQNFFPFYIICQLSKQSLLLNFWGFNMKITYVRSKTCLSLGITSPFPSDKQTFPAHGLKYAYRDALWSYCQHVQ